MGELSTVLAMTHDPLCLLSKPCDVVGCDDDGHHRYAQDNSVKCACCEVECECDFIAMVRADTIEHLWLAHKERQAAERSSSES